jgi:hypothetical protein
MGDGYKQCVHVEVNDSNSSKREMEREKGIPGKAKKTQTC